MSSPHALKAQVHSDEDTASLCKHTEICPQFHITYIWTIGLLIHNLWMFTLTRHLFITTIWKVIKHQCEELFVLGLDVDFFLHFQYVIRRFNKKSSVKKKKKSSGRFGWLSDRGVGCAAESFDEVCFSPSWNWVSVWIHGTRCESELTTAASVLAGETFTDCFFFFGWTHRNQVAVTFTAVSQG